jgi:hypothetical protein
LATFVTMSMHGHTPESRIAKLQLFDRRCERSFSFKITQPFACRSKERKVREASAGFGWVWEVREASREFGRLREVSERSGAFGKVRRVRRVR